MLLPTGAGQPLPLEPGPLETIEAAAFFPDGRSLLVQGSEPGKGSRLHVQALSGGPPRAVQPEGVVAAARPISPDGLLVLATCDGAPCVVKAGSGETRPVASARATDLPLGWHADGRRVYLRDLTSPLPVRIDLVDVESGARTRWREIDLPDRAGLLGVGALIVQPDGSALACYAPTLMSDLYLIDGVR